MRKDVSLFPTGMLILAGIYLILAGCSSSGDGGSSDVRLAGIVSDPFVSAARVWCDVNDNGYFDDADKSTLSGIDGAYQFSGNDCATDTLIVDGLEDTVHVDESGNVISIFTGRMKAPGGSKFVSPLTSLQQTLIESDTSDDDAETKAKNASAKVAKALGLVDSTTGEVLPDLDFSTLDINAADQKGAQKAAIVAQQLLLDTTAAMQGTGGSPMTPESFESVTNALASAIKTATQPLIGKDGGVDPVVVKQAVQNTVESVVQNVAAYSDFDSSSIMGAIGDAVVVNSQQAAAIVDESGASAITADKLSQSQGTGSELIRVTMDSIKSYVNGSGDFDGDGEADIGQGDKSASDVFSELADVLAAVSSGLSEAVSSDAGNAATDKTLSDDAAGALIANVIQQTIGAALENRGLGNIASRVVSNVDVAMTNGDVTGLGDTAANHAPVAFDRTLTLRKGETKTAKLRARDIDPGDSLTFAISDESGKATLTSTGNGEFTYDASALSAGTYTFAFTVTDDNATPLSDTGTVKVTVLGANLAPLAKDLNLAVRLGESVTSTFPVLNFDRDPLTFSFVANPSSIATATGNQFTINTTGITAGSYTVTYLVDDGNGGSDSGDITVDVLGLTQNNPPIAFNGVLKLKTGATGTGKLRATDPEGATLIFSETDDNLTLVDGGPAYTYDATNLGVGVYFAEFTVSDGTDSDTGMLRITVTSADDTANTPPLARDSNLKLLTGETKTGTLRGFDLEGEALSFAISGDPTGGSVTLGENASFSYVAPSTAGEYSFSFTVTDASGASATGSVSLFVISANKPPRAFNTAVEIDKGTATSPFAGVFQAIDDGTGLTYTLTSDDGGRATLASGGESTGAFNYDFSNADVGPHEVKFNVKDDADQFGSGTMLINIIDSTVSNNAPVALNRRFTVDQGSIGSGVLTAFDPDAGDTLTYVITGGSATLTSTGSTDGSYTFDASSVSPGTYTIMFSVTDQGGLSDTGEIEVLVRAVSGTNNPPVARESLPIVMDSGAVKFGRFRASDLDLDDTLAFSVTNSGGLTVTIIDAANGKFKVDATGVQGEFTITFSVTDGTDTDTGTVTVIVNATNSPPVAADSTLTVVKGETKDGTVTATDADGSDTLTFTKLTDPVQGTLTVNANGTYTYDATGVAPGTYSFDFKVADSLADDTGTVTITVTEPANNPPTAAAGTLSVVTGTSATGQLGGNDLDGADTLTYSIVQQPSQGTVTLTSATLGTYSFDAASAAAGVYTFIYGVTDGMVASPVQGTVTVTVTAPANNAPVAQDASLLVLSGGTKTGVLQGSDADGDTLTYAISDANSRATLTNGANSGSFSYDASSVSDGTATFTYTVTDPSGASDSGTITVTIGSFLKVSSIKVNDIDKTRADFESSGASVTVPLTSFGFNLEAMGNIGSSMTVKLGVSVVDTDSTIAQQSRKKIDAVLNAGTLTRASNGALSLKVPAGAKGQIV
ncbi:MAG TPA: tandem-95 repeat protein, partial [Gammaproteobacteria bacterium]|nr:tandem-95 repeat protein [Gammaproteobacteria bacterium]